MKKCNLIIDSINTICNKAWVRVQMIDAVAHIVTAGEELRYFIISPFF
jgi:hypothetical protein